MYVLRICLQEPSSFRVLGQGPVAAGLVLVDLDLKDVHRAGFWLGAVLTVLHILRLQFKGPHVPIHASHILCRHYYYFVLLLLLLLPECLPIGEFLHSN